MGGVWNGFLFGGGVGSGLAAAGVPVGSLIMPAYRIAGITQRAMIVPSSDMFDEAIPELNRFLKGWSCDGHKIFSTLISAPFPLANGQKIYTIGPGGDFDVARPLFIRGANILYPSSPIIRQPVRILTDRQWQAVQVQDVPGAPPYLMYYDHGNNASGQGQIYFRYQPPPGYSLELYTWQSLQSDFRGKDDVAIFPDGYEDALVQNLAIRLAALNPNMANLHPTAPDNARRALQALMTLNTSSPRVVQDPQLTGWGGDTGHGWLDGDIV